MASLQTQAANALFREYLQDGDPRHLDAAIRLLQSLLSTMDGNNPQFPDVFARLGSYSTARYEVNRRTDSFSDVIRLGRSIWQSEKHCHPAVRAACLYYLAMHLEWQYRESEDISKLEEAIRAERESVRLEAMSGRRSSHYTHKLAFDLWTMYQRTGIIAQLDESIELGRLALELEPNEQRHLRSDNVSLRLERRYRLLGNVKDLDEAISFTRQAIEATPDDHPALGDYLESLAAQLRQRCKDNPTISDAQEAAQSQRIALELLGNTRSDEANMLFGLGIDLQCLYELKQDLCDLDASIEAYQQAAQLFPSDHPSQPSILSGLGETLRKRFEMCGRRSDIEDGVQAAREALSRARTNNPRLEHMMNLALGLGERYETYKKLEDLDEAIELGRQVLASKAVVDKDRAYYLSGHSDNLYRRFNCGQNEEDLAESVSLGRQAVALAATDHPGRSNFLNNLGSHLLHLQALTQELTTLNEAITLFQSLVHTTPPERNVRAIYMSNLGVALLRRYKLQETMCDLEEATKLLQEALTVLPKTYKDRETISYSFADTLKHVYIKTRDSNDRGAMEEASLGLDTVQRESLLKDLYAITGDLSYIEDKLQDTKKVLDSLPEKDPRRQKLLTDYSWDLGAHFDAIGDRDSLRMAVKMAREATACSSGDISQQAMSLYVLGVQLSNEYEFLGNNAALEEAIQVTRQAITLTPEHHHHLPMLLNGLGLRLRSFYMQTSKAEVLEEGLRISQQALKATPATSSDMPALASNRATLLYILYTRTGQVTTLEEAIKLAQQSLKLTPDSHILRPRYLHFLALYLHIHYERTLEMASLTEAIRLNREIMATCRDSNPDKPDYSICLAGCLLTRYERTQDVDDLQEAISTARISIDATPPSHPRLAAMLDTLANCLGVNYARSGEQVHMDEAIQFGRQVIEATPPGAVMREGFICNQIQRLHTRYSITGNLDDLDEAIQLGNEAIDLPFSEPQNRATVLYQLGRCQILRGDPDALGSLYSAWSLEDAPLQVRVYAASRCIGLLHAQGQSEEGMELGFEILDLLPAIHTRSLQQSDQQKVMSTFSGIASELCSLCIDQGKLDDALRSLEQGRAVIIGQLLSDSTSLPKLSKDRPDLALRYEALLWELRAPTSSAESLVRKNAAKRPRSEAMRDLDECHREIRNVEGYQGFLLPPSQAEMQKCADPGTVVVVNVTKLRSDALLITSDGVKNLPLPEMSISEVMKFVRKDWRIGKRSERQQINENFTEYLAWLWDSCVKHVVHAIEQTRTQEASGLPKVWWIGAGYANLMPFHAAGVHTNRSADNAMDRLISSYTPSIKSLMHARDWAARALEHQTTSSMLIVTMPSTPKGPHDRKKPKNLPGVTEEAREIMKVAGSAIETTLHTEPSVEQVLAALPACRIAHFACHGTSDAADPSNSCVILQRKGENAVLEQDRLTVHQVSGLRMDRAQIAYLSACSTAENKALELRDEVLHVVSGFQVSGFPHVVGCLWPAGDGDCVKVAATFYFLVLEDKGTSCEPAEALRHAVIALRDEDPDMPLLWAQFVHYGW